MHVDIHSALSHFSGIKHLISPPWRSEKQKNKQVCGERSSSLETMSTYRKGQKEDPRNCRPISLVLTLRELQNRSLQKLFPSKHISRTWMWKANMDKLKGQSCIDQKPCSVAESSGYHQQFDFHKVFDTASLKILFDKSVRHGLGIWNTKCLRNWLNCWVQRLKS